MVSYTVPPGQLPSKPSSPEQLSANVKAECTTPNQGLIGAPSQWQSHGTMLKGLPLLSLARVTPLHRHSPVPGQPSPKLKHHLCGERETDISYEEFAHDRKRSKIHDSSVHTISSQMQSQLLSPRGVPGSAGTVLTRETSVPAPKYSEPHHSSDRNASAGTRLPSVSLNQLSSPSPLGLTLRKTPSLLDLISMKLDQDGIGDQGSSNPDSFAQDAAKTRVAKCMVPTASAQDKLKASNFPASSLKVGTWERVSRYEGDLVGKCYYAKRKLVWEVLESGLKSKIEIQWTDISAMKASCPENLPGTLEIEVSRPPLFFRETNPQPRKHTLWQATSDFTGGQATICKRHSLQFPEGVLNRHYEKLVQCDPRLKSLVEGTLSLRPTPDFEHTSWMFDGKHQHIRTHQPIAHQNSSHDGNKKQQTFIHQAMHVLPGNAAVIQGEIISDPKSEPRPLKMQSSDLASPSSVMDPRGSDESANSDTEDLKLHDDLSEYDGIDLMYSSTRSVGEVHELPDVKPSGNNLFMIGVENFASSGRKTLDEIAHVLLGDSASSSNDTMMLASTVGHMPAAFAGEFQLPHPVLPEFLDGSTLSDTTHHCHVLSSFQVKSEMGHEADQLNFAIASVGNSTLLGRLPPSRDPNFSALMSCFRKRGTAGDLLINLPRPATLPQFFENSPQVPMSRYDQGLMRPSYFGSEKLR